MCNKVLDLAKAEGISQIRLYVDKENSTAQAVYQKSAWQSVTIVCMRRGYNVDYYYSFTMMTTILPDDQSHPVSNTALWAVIATIEQH